MEEKKFDPKEFAATVQQRFKFGAVPICPFCGGNQFTTTDDMATIMITKSFHGMEIGNSIPAGMIICQKCGHIEFFALGALGLLPKKEDNGNGNK